MKQLLNLLAAIALLVWGTHLVRTGILLRIEKCPAAGGGRTREDDVYFRIVSIVAWA